MHTRVLMTMNDKEPEGFYAFIDASKRAQSRGDNHQAERLLLSSLRRAEQHLLIVECAMKEILDQLISLYANQERAADVSTLQNRLDQIEELIERHSPKLPRDGQ